MHDKHFLSQNDLYVVEDNGVQSILTIDGSVSGAMDETWTCRFFFNTQSVQTDITVVNSVFGTCN